MRYDLILLHFREPMRGGSAEAGRVPSDTLWSALYAADARLHGAPLDPHDPYRVSSAFPYLDGEGPLLPRPRVTPRGDAPASTDKKTVKQLRFVRLRDFDTLARGEHLAPDDLRAALAAQERALRPRRAGPPAENAEGRLRAALKNHRASQGTPPPSPDAFARDVLGANLADLSEADLLLLLEAARGRLPRSARVARQRNTQDRVTAHTDTFLTESVQQPKLYFLLGTSGEAQRARLLSALRFLADHGLGGMRTQGSGQFEYRVQSPPDALARRVNAPGQAVLLSLAHPTPAEAEALDASDDAQYTLTRRDGFIDASTARRVPVWMLGEGSTLPAPLHGQLLNVAPPGHPHPVYRSGLAVTLGVPS